MLFRPSQIQTPPPWSQFGLDFVNSLPLSKSVILTVVDRFSKVAHFITLSCHWPRNLLTCWFPHWDCVRKCHDQQPKLWILPRRQELFSKGCLDSLQLAQGKTLVVCISVTRQRKESYCLFHRTGGGADSKMVQRVLLARGSWAILERGSDLRSHLREATRQRETTTATITQHPDR